MAFRKRISLNRTKAGLLFGEAVVITNNAIKKDFRNMMKRAGAMLSKGRLLGVQFSELFTNGLYLEISSHAMECAQEIQIGRAHV